jgi:hypothetical protein
VAVAESEASKVIRERLEGETCKEAAQLLKQFQRGLAAAPSWTTIVEDSKGYFLDVQPVDYRTGGGWWSAHEASRGRHSRARYVSGI